MEKTTFSIITAFYNEEAHMEYFLEQMNSLKQGDFTYKLILIDDCSTDNSVGIINQFMNNNKLNFSYELKRMEVNSGAGIARNSVLDDLDSEYLLIVDGDDILTYNSLYNLNEIKKHNEVDIISYQYLYVNKEKHTKLYPKKVNYSLDELYINEDVEILFNDVDYYSCNKAYKVSFIEENEIRFGNQRRYEDFIFIIKAYTRANSLYVTGSVCSEITVNSNSVTRRDITGTEHMDDFILALNQIYDSIIFRNSKSKLLVSKTLFNKTFVYVDKRTGDKYKKGKLKQALKIIFENNSEDFATAKKTDDLFTYVSKTKMYEKPEVMFLLKVYNKNKPVQMLENSKKIKIIRKVSKVKYFYDDFKNSDRLERKYKSIKTKFDKRTLDDKYLKPTLYQVIDYLEQVFPKLDTIVMYGFDYKDKGNSKYLREMLITSKTKSKVIFLPDVCEKYSFEYFYYLATAKYVIIESLVDGAFKIRYDAELIQLWHGSPIKKLALDSPERTILKNNPNSRVEKLSNFSKYDMVLAENEYSVKKFCSAFQLDEDKIIRYQYPRTTWLLNNSNNSELKQSIKDKNAINDAFTILYAPTWRDYGTRDEVLLDVMSLNLDKEVNIIYMEHTFRMKNKKRSNFTINDESDKLEYDTYDIENYLSNNIKKPAKINVIYPKDIETQEAILISDMCITDYSSISFDFMHTEKPVLFLWKDFEEYEYDRGLYSELFKYFGNDYIFSNESELNEIINCSINNDVKQEIPPEFKSFKNDILSIFRDDENN